MNIKIVENKYLNALFVLMLFSAIVHMLVLFCLAVRFGNLYFLNYFNVLSISYFVPNFLNSFWGNVASFLFVALFYSIILKINKIK